MPGIQESTEGWKLMFRRARWIVFLTEGSERTITIGGTTIQFKKTTPRNMATAGRISGLVIQALRFMGKTNVDEKIICHLAATVSDSDKKQLMKVSQADFHLQKIRQN